MLSMLQELQLKKVSLLAAVLLFIQIRKFKKNPSSEVSI